MKKWLNSGRCEVHRVPLDTAIDDDAGEVALVVAWFGLQQQWHEINDPNRDIRVGDGQLSIQ